MDIKQAMDILKNLVVSPEDEIALQTIKDAIQHSAQPIEKPSSRQRAFMVKMAANKYKSLQDVSVELGFGDVDKLTKQSASKLIKEMISQGYKEEG